MEWLWAIGRYYTLHSPAGVMLVLAGTSAWVCPTGMGCVRRPGWRWQRRRSVAVCAALHPAMVRQSGMRTHVPAPVIWAMLLSVGSRGSSLLTSVIVSVCTGRLSHHAGGNTLGQKNLAHALFRWQGSFIAYLGFWFFLVCAVRIFWVQALQTLET
jgi:hypothetical protein